MVRKAARYAPMQPCQNSHQISKAPYGQKDGWIKDGQNSRGPPDKESSKYVDRRTKASKGLVRGPSNKQSVT
jgi:hypothetical protein